MKAVVLVGGFGTRLRPLTLTTPKQMLPVLHRPMIEWVLEHLARHGVDEAVLALGYRPDAFTDAYPEGVCAGVRLRYAIEPEPLDTAGAIRFAAEHAGIDERFLVVNGDVLADVDVTALVADHDRAGADATIHLIRVEDPSAFGVVPTDGDGYVEAFVEKPPRDEAPTDLINAGTYVLEPSVLAQIPPGRRVSIERETFPALVAGRRLRALHLPCYWLDTGTPAQYVRASLDLLDGLRVVPGGLAAATHPDAVVAPGAKAVRSVIGSGCRIEDGAEVVDSVLLPGSVVRSGAAVRASALAARAAVGPRAMLSRCVLGEDVAVPEGAELTDARVPAPGA